MQENSNLKLLWNDKKIYIYSNVNACKMWSIFDMVRLKALLI